MEEEEEDVISGAKRTKEKIHLKKRSSVLISLRRSKKMPKTNSLFSYSFLSKKLKIFEGNICLRDILRTRQKSSSSDFDASGGG